MNTTCTHCHQPMKRWESIERGNAIDSRPLAWHPACYAESAAA